MTTMSSQKCKNLHQGCASSKPPLEEVIAHFISMLRDAQGVRVLDITEPEKNIHAPRRRGAGQRHRRASRGRAFVRAARFRGMICAKPRSRADDSCSRRRSRLGLKARDVRERFTKPIPDQTRWPWGSMPHSRARRIVSKKIGHLRDNIDIKRLELHRLGLPSCICR